jgi:hypothetical protein
MTFLHSSPSGADLSVLALKGLASLPAEDLEGPLGRGTASATDDQVVLVTSRLSVGADSPEGLIFRNGYSFVCSFHVLTQKIVFWLTTSRLRGKVLIRRSSLRASRISGYAHSSLRSVSLLRVGCGYLSKLCVPRSTLGLVDAVELAGQSFIEDTGGRTSGLQHAVSCQIEAEARGYRSISWIGRRDSLMSAVFEASKVCRDVHPLDSQAPASCLVCACDTRAIHGCWLRSMSAARRILISRTRRLIANSSVTGRAGSVGYSSRSQSRDRDVEDGRPDCWAVARILFTGLVPGVTEL